MADAVTARTTYSGRYVVRHLTNISDSTGESAVIKADVSTFTTRAGVPATYFTVDKIVYDIQGFDGVRLYFDATTDDELALISGSGELDWSAFGGITDPKSAGTTGDIKLTTAGAASGATYDITLYLRPKA